MNKHYIYRLDHDTGYAPNIDDNICSLCGCHHTIEAYAQKGSWIFGVGGINTGKRDCLIYAMLVDETPAYETFRKEYPGKSKYLSEDGFEKDKRVIFSKHFYYFGNNAIILPRKFESLIYKGRNCKCLSESQKDEFISYLKKYFQYGVHGSPNNYYDQNTGKFLIHKQDLGKTPENRCGRKKIFSC